ncbi:hypothetical protein F5883DRAFT_395216, partial [Diaporthe sp. PMI_573]
MGLGTRLFSIAVTAALAVAAGPCSPRNCSGATLPLPVRDVYQFDTDTWIENLAVRPNGDLLLIVDEDINNPVHPVALYQLANPTSPQPELSLVYSFNPLGTILGIAEIQPEVYAVLAENFTGSFEAVPGTVRLYTFDYNNGDDADPIPDTVLVADMYASLVWAIDITTGGTTVFAQTPEMAEAYNFTQMGINGLRVGQDDYLYFTNSDLKSVYRLPLDLENCGSEAAP